MIRKTLHLFLASAAAMVSAFAASAQTYTNEAASVVWPFNTADYATTYTAAPEGSFSTVSFDQGVCIYKGLLSTTMCPDIQFVSLASKNGTTDQVKWSVKPAKGLTFTPTHISFYIARNGTDGAGKDVSVSGEIAGGSKIEFSKITPHRNNRITSEDKFGNDASYTIKYDYTLTAEQQTALASGDGFNLVLNNGYGNTKTCMYSDVHIEGLLNGTAQSVEKYTVTLAASPAEAASVSIAPIAESYEAGTEVKIKAAKNFGYKFVNWTNAAGVIVSTTPEFSYTVNRNAVLTANYEAVNTYELKTAVSAANPYQLILSPLPTMVDGKQMYEDGTMVTLSAMSNPIVTFTNWSDGQNSSEICIKMDANKEITAMFAAADYLAGWDFYLAGNNSRPADFASADNAAAALVLRNAAGNVIGWLDKCQVPQGGYEGRPAAVNWTTAGVGDFYWQTTLNASAFTDINVQGAMTYNYNAYTVYNVEASLDGENWVKVGTVNLEGTKKWIDYSYTLPAEFNNQPSVQIRWIADKTSEVKGTSSANDGISFGATYITGTAQLVNDGTAPVLLATVPAAGAEGVSINGKIVLTFDEKVKVAEGATATLNGKKLELSAVGTTVIAPYANLNYGTDYTFTLSAGAVADLCDNAVASPVSVNFTTRTRPEVAKSLYDFIVPDAGTFKEAIAAANARADQSKRFTIFIKKGYYELPWSTTETVTGTNVNAEGVTYPSPITNLTGANVSIIGEDRDATVIKNLMYNVTPSGTPYPIEGLKNVTTLKIQSSARGTYIQDLTLRNGMNDNTGRGEALQDNATQTICKNVTLWGYQDTYCSNSQGGRSYFEGGVMRGRTDFLCGKGDIFYNGVTLQVVGDGGYIAVPSQGNKYGYILRDCTIVGETSDVNGKYNLGRPWGSGTPQALYVNTCMKAQPRAEGWAEMSGGWPLRFAEYNSFTENGTQIDLSSRKKVFASSHANNPVLTCAEAEELTIEKVMGGTDGWDPTFYTEAAPAPEDVVLGTNAISWDASNYARLWAVCVDGKAVAFTTEPYISLSTPEIVAAVKPGSEFSVRAANEMGGLSAAVKAQTSTLLNAVNATPVATDYYNLQGVKVAATTPGVLIKVDTLADGTTTASKVMSK